MSQPKKPKPRPRQKPAAPTYPLKLTDKQRETLLAETNVTGKLRKKVAQAGEGPQVIPVTWDELLCLEDELGAAVQVARCQPKVRLAAILDRVWKLLDQHDPTNVPPPRPARPPKLPRPDRLYQFRVTLLETNPPIWRRIQVPDCTLATLHDHLQTAMGWTNSHLDMFEIQGKSYGNPAFLGFGLQELKCLDSTQTLLSDIVPKTGKPLTFVYEYDFGDRWRHELVYEGEPGREPRTQYPRCLAGARACPPEDCGGVWGYLDFLEAIGDPSHEDHQDLLQWIGGYFDPEALDVDRTTQAMQTGLPHLKDDDSP